MPYDGSVVGAIVSELNNKIINGKIDKVYQPEKDELIISIRSYKESHKLLVSSSPVYPRVHLTDENKSNPAVPPTFCMLLRKHLMGGKIISVKQPELERIIEITVECIDELGYSTTKALIAEIMGRHSNVIFIDKGSNKIIDSIKRVNFEVSSVREILPGRTYVYPPSGDKHNPLETDSESFITNILSQDSSIRADKYLLGTYNGISPVVAREICHKAAIDSNIDIKNLSKNECEALYAAFDSLMSQIRNGSFSPSVYFEEDRPVDFSCFELDVYKEHRNHGFNNISKAVETFYYEKDLKDRLKQRAGDIHRIITSRLDRCYKKREILNDELFQAQNSNIYKIYGDLLTSNLHELKKGPTKARLLNYYDEEGSYIEIPLDTQLTPIANAQRYYKYYNKSKNALKTIGHQIIENKEELLYLEAQLDNLDKCSEDIEINEIREELTEQGYIRGRKSVKKKQVKASKPMHFLSSKGFDIYVGKNNVQNDFLTLKFAASNDIWLHTKDIPGSHVIIKTNGQPIDDETLSEAANLASFYSKGKQSSKVPVDYAPKKQVKKPAGAKPGMVIYDNYKTIYITPDETKIKSMKHIE